jgi:hypothetical protein
MKTAWFTIAGTVLVLGIATAVLLGGRAPDTAVTPAPMAIDETDAPAVPGKSGKPDAGTETETEYTAPAEFARRLIHVPDTRHPRENAAPSTSERDITADKLESLLQSNLEYALEGAMESSYFVVRARQACERFASSPEELERRIERTNRKMERDIKRGRELPAGADNRLPFRTTANPDVNRAKLQDWFDACQRVRSLFTPDFRQQLEAQALAGNVMARYLYAVWPPDALDVGEAFEQQYGWEGLARDFSQANLDAGEVAGLMAIAQSYRRGLFTSKNDDLALAFTLASFNCGFEPVSLGKFLDDRINHLAASDDPADQRRLQFVLVEADRLGLYCRY